jgi:hypothetical protein
MKITRIAIIIIVWVLFFFYFIPTDVAVEWTVSLALLGSIVMLGLTAYFFFSIDKVGLIDITWIKIILIFLSFFGFAILFIYNTCSREKKEFEQNGVLCKGQILFEDHGQAENNKKYPILIKYQINEQQSNLIPMQLKWKNFNETYFNTYVPVIYSSKFPYLARVISHKNEFIKYAHYFDTINKNILKDIPFSDTSDEPLIHNLKVLIDMGESAESLKKQLIKSKYSEQQADSMFNCIPLEITYKDSLNTFKILSVLATIISMIDILMKWLGRD